MEFSNTNLTDALNRGFIGEDLNSIEELTPKVLVNKKESGTKVLTSIKHSLTKCDEFWFSTAFITSSGVSTLINILQELKERGVKGRILTSQYLNFTQPEALRKLLKFENLDLRIVTTGNFHSKGYLFKKDDFFDFIVGSSNLTAQALTLNKELNLKVTAKHDGEVISNYLNEFNQEFSGAEIVDDGFIQIYERIYEKHKNPIKPEEELLSGSDKVTPNEMQKKALIALDKLRANGDQKALLVSACATGKTHLSAFDAKKAKSKKLLFIVHRENITKKAMDTYRSIFSTDISMGLYTGNSKEADNDFIFSTIQTLSRTEHLEAFKPNHFDYIVIDESHRAGANSYLKILNYFTPKFILGLTGTPERTDGFDIFDLFDHNIAFELRLQQALDENMVCPFHYYGVTDLLINGELIEENANFQYLVSEDRINHIIEKINFYGSDNGVTRGLIFCSSVDECVELSNEFNRRDYRTIALTGASTEAERNNAISKLESNDIYERLDYIFTVDIFNEGVDIPKLNQVVMLRPTQSAIVFVQQLGRGLRKSDRKDYLTVIDFIGNYKNNFLIPIALYGDTSYNKDKLRRVLTNSDKFIPGSSTINFDKISKERVFKAISQTNLQTKKDLLHDYKILKFKLGQIPMMMDFINHASREPNQFVHYSKSYFNFVENQEESLQNKINGDDKIILEQLSSEVFNAVRVEEGIILRDLINNKTVSTQSLKTAIKANYGYKLKDETIASCVRNLNFKFVQNNLNKNKQKISANEAYGISTITYKDDQFKLSEKFAKSLNNETLKDFVLDAAEYSIKSFENAYRQDRYSDSFMLYGKYSRKDVHRILNWDENPIAQNVGGYMIDPKTKTCPIFVNYHKEDDISETTKYEDKFLSRYIFEWFSKSKRTLNSKDVLAIINSENELRLPLFIKKNNDEGIDFYYMGDLIPIPNEYEQTSMPKDDSTSVSVVKIQFKMINPVSSSMYDYITDHT
jgi:superfamily II DNA or RNA helicase/HKD family nuclease